MESAPDDGGEPGREVPQLSEDFVAEVPEEVRHRLEVKVDETVDDPCYGTPVSQIAQQEEVSHGSQGSHVDPSVPTVGSTAGGQRPVPTELDVTSLQTALESGRGERVRQVSPEQRKEDVSQISRSLQYMTGLLTNLVTRVDRVEQRQSTSGSAAPQSTDEGSQMTPSAATPALHPSWDEVDRLGGQMSALTFGGSGPSLGAGPPPGMEWRPLAPMSRMMEGTFSSDSSGTARRRMEEALRGVPGALLGPLAGVNIPLALDGLPIGEDWRQPMEVDGVPLREHGTSELSSMSRPQQALELSSMSRPQQASELSSMSRPQQASELSSMSRPQQALELPSMSRPQQALELSSMSRPQQASELSSMPRSQQASELPSMSGPQSAAMLPSTQESSSRSMPRGSLQNVGVEEGSSSLGWYHAPRAPEESRSALEQGQVCRSPVSVAALQPPLESRPAVPGGGGGLVIGAPPVGLVMVDGLWREYRMIRGQMVVQPSQESGTGAACAPLIHGCGGQQEWRSSCPPPPPPYPPTTPKAATANWNANLTPGGTPIPPPPPTTPLTSSTVASGGGVGEDVEEPSKLVTRLPSLPSAKGGDAAVVAGDWLAQLEPSMSSLSSTAATWWSSLMERVKDLYGLWLESAPVARLTIRQQVLTRRPPPDRHHRVEQRAAMLLLDALPEELRHEAVSARAVTAEAMVFMVHCAYQPGGAGEKAHLLQFLTVPETGNGLENTLLLARKWIRLFRRGRELQVVLPDPSLLCRGLDKLVSATFSGNKHPSASFRVASFRLERQLEYRATAVDIEDYAYLILGELEAAQLAQPLPSQPKVARLDDHTAAADEKDKDRDKGKGKAKGKKPCWGWQDGTGCRFGANCLFLHAPLGPGRCWECGSDAHLKPQCPLLGQGGKASGGGAVGSGKGSGGAAQSANAGQNSSSTSSTAETAGASVEEKPPRKPKRKGGGKDRGPKEAVRKTEEETLAEDTRPTASGGNVEDASARTEFFEEATKALKSLRLAKLTMKSLQGSFGGGGRALIDSGATTSMRTAREGEVRGLPLRTVLLAEGETAFYQLPGGTLLTTKVTAPIVAMSDLMEIGCRITWCSSEGCSVVHPVKGDLGARVINGCPEVDEDVGLKLIEEAEITKLRRREAELAVNRLVQGCDAARCGEGKLDWELGAKAVKDLGNGVGLSWAWLRQAFPEAPSWLVAAVPVVAETDGAGVPWNRHERKKWKRASAVAVHLFCGRDRSTWRSRAEAALVDQAENVMADATYSALLELAASGKVKTVFGGPPCRTFSALRNLPTAGAGEGPRPLRDREGDGRWGRQGLTEWETWRVIQFLRDKLKWCWWQFDQGPLGHPRRKPTRILSSMPCPRELRDVRGPSRRRSEIMMVMVSTLQPGLPGLRV